jgi:hypothetical protein
MVPSRPAKIKLGLGLLRILIYIRYRRRSTDDERVRACILGGKTPYFDSAWPVNQDSQLPHRGQ